MLAGLGTDESGERGGKRGLDEEKMCEVILDKCVKVPIHLLPRPFWPNETLWGMAGSGT